MERVEEDLVTKRKGKESDREMASYEKEKKMGNKINQSNSQKEESNLKERRTSFRTE